MKLTSFSFLLILNFHHSVVAETVLTLTTGEKQHCLFLPPSPNAHPLIRINTCGTGPRREVWSLQKVDKQYIRIQAYHSERQLCIQTTEDPDTPVVMDDCSSEVGQQWRLKCDKSKNNCQIMSHGEKCLQKLADGFGSWLKVDQCSERSMWTLKEVTV
ncbi:hypothetical protein Fcan01_11334 [Folsomia candida]|uniref:Uncharacterized protein n=1 Tax=Folsomia candida TaxID=158441 RepID=A0A226EA50_FOLCA|nr:hypothetical protein Fcan01_11334 [Folsomia candida]